MRSFPALLIQGPRATGKTTIARQVAADVVRLDEPGAAAVFRADPDSALRARAKPVLLDEWQEVPEVMGAVKRAVDDGAEPGSFLLTGSVLPPLQGGTWPGTGRLVTVPMYGVTEREARHALEGGSFLDKLAAADPRAFPLPAVRPDLKGYVELALRSSFPELVYRAREDDMRRAFLEGYLQQLFERDLTSLAPRTERDKLFRYFQVLCLSTAGSAAHHTLYEAAGINHLTATRYDELFSRLFVAEQVPSWTNNRLQRLLHQGKRYVTDAGLAAAATGLDVREVMSDGDLLGRLFDTFALSQLRPELVLSRRRVGLHHLRTNKGRQEVDLLFELDGGKVLALELKATASPSPADAKHLAWLRDALGTRFIAGAVVHSGPDVFRLGDRLLAVPLCAAWGGPSRTGA